MRTVLNKTVQQTLILTLLLLLMGCNSDDETIPSKLRVGVLPDQRAAILERRYAPLIAHLNQQLEMDVQLVIPETYEDLVRKFGAREVDVAFFGGTTFVASLVRYDAVPLVMRDIDLEFTTYFVAAAADQSTKLEDFQGRRFSFGAETSTSGHLMPRHFLQQKGMVPEQFFSEVRYSGGHDKTIKQVLDGSADLGAANAEVIRGMIEDGRLQAGAIRVVWETPPYADYVWAVQSDLEPGFRNRLKDAFLALSFLDEAGAGILKPMGANGFLPAREEEFAGLIKIMADLPMFQDLLKKGD